MHDSLDPPAEVDVYFFLSYARSDDDAYVARFYRDLCSEVRVRAGLPSAQEVGFFDTESIEIGAPWSVRLVTALSTCRTFVALCSPRYFVSEPCGREWQIFSDRQSRREQRTTQPSTILPVVWLPPRQMPAVVEELQYSAAALGEAYQREGLRQLMRLRRYRDAYVRCLSALAVQIVDVASNGPEPSTASHHVVDFSSVDSAFHDNHSAQPASQPGSERQVDASRVHFVVVAPDRHKAATVRQDVSYYGETPMDWAPYRPSLPGSLVEFARRIAEDRGFDSRAVGLDLFVRDRGHYPAEIVVLLVDGWATQLGDFRLGLARLSELLRSSGAPASAAMVPSSHEDSETRASWWRLSDGLRSIFLDRITAGDTVTFRWSILTHRTFDEDLQVVLEVARNLIFMRGPVHGQPAEPHRTRPILEGP
jgi:FxsC-like protein